MFFMQTCPKFVTFSFHYGRNLSVTSAHLSAREKTKTHPESRFNSMKIQMLSKSLHEQIFKPDGFQHKFERNEKRSKENCIKKLKEFDLWDKNDEVTTEVDFKCPDLIGKNINDHFCKIAAQQSGEYFEALLELSNSALPCKPNNWSKKSGWTKYNVDSEGKETCEAVDFPEDEGLVFDCEVLVPEGEMPVMATAASKDNWYSWCSERISKNVFPDGLGALIPLETTKKLLTIPEKGKKRIVVGHNVSYDRARVKEQFFIQETKLRFMDTMSMHMAVSGFTGTQRNLFKSADEEDRVNVDSKSSSWLRSGTLNNLSDVHDYYCGSKLDKQVRNIFVEGSIEEVRENFNLLINYCAKDVEATHNVLSKLFPIFQTRFPNPVTFAAMLEMGQMYLPINSHWEEFIKMADAAYDGLNKELKSTLIDIANETCSKIHNEKYTSDKWLWDLDWSGRSHKLLQKPRKGWVYEEHCPANCLSYHEDSPLEEKVSLGQSTSLTYKPSKLMNEVLETACLLPKVRPHLPGYPKWYIEMCKKESEKTWTPGPVALSTLSKVTPKLLQMTWNGYPLHRDQKQGWGYLVPKNERLHDKNSNLTLDIEEELDSDLELPKIENIQSPVDIQDIPEDLLFYKLPHQFGLEKNVGSPLSQYFLKKIEQGNLSSANPSRPTRCLEINMSCSYWRSSQQRIRSQIFMFLPAQSLPVYVREHLDHEDGNLGAIIPLTIVNGTVTRRAVEPTWLTASNVREISIGSELKAMIQAPPGYDFVGADVDSQELWIASLLGDAEYGGEHGCTPLSWMTLQGSKSNGTDLHSKTANAISITRDQAKAFNYSRIYGAGQRLSRNMLENFNHKISKKEASEKISKLYSLTKGTRKFMLSMEGRYYLKKLNVKLSLSSLETSLLSLQEVNMLKQAANDKFGHLKQIDIRDLVAGSMWEGGMESEMFNMLEKIANRYQPETPFLGSRISRALEPAKVKGNFLPSRMNWVVQSSAVDYMHLVIVCMRWLIDKYSIDARFSISIHDELRYLSVSKDKYRTALALQISNLFTRCMFAHKLGMKDLPLSVAFFSSVEIDKALRKRHDDECVTPSNPMGLEKRCGIPPGESLDIFDILERTKNGQLEKDID